MDTPHDPLDRTVVHVNADRQLDDRLVFTKRQVVEVANEPVVPNDFSEANVLRALEYAALPFVVDADQTDTLGIRHIFVSTR